MSAAKQSQTREIAPVHGMLAEYATPGELIVAAKAVRDEGYSRWDTFTPFPVHGIDPAMGIKPTVLPWIVLGAGLTGCVCALLMQWWMNAVDYRFVIGGKPFFSLPANIPIAFELTVLFSALTAFVGMLLLNRLPRPAHPLHLNERFARASDDRFFLVIESADPKYDALETKQLLERTAVVGAVESVTEDTASSTQLPKGVIYSLLVAATLLCVPFALAGLARVSTSSLPRFHIVPDMDFQQKFKAQRPNPLFADGRSMRPPVEGTVALGQLRGDDHFYRGKVATGGWARTFPAGIELGAATMARGKERFGMYCAPCHGHDGLGQGIVHQRVLALDPQARATWVPPAELVRDSSLYMPIGQVFDVITNGIRNMQGYGSQIEPVDRWAIALYLRALQKTHTASLQDVAASALPLP